jgi:hypothetical protein
MKLLDVITAAKGRVNGGDSYLWNCFGPNAQYMEFCDADGMGFASCVFDTKTYEVYQITMEIPGQDQTFLWNNTSHVQQYFDECREREVDPYLAWDDVKYSVVDYGDLMLKYMADIADTYYDNLPIKMAMPGTMGGATVKFGDTA